MASEEKDNFEKEHVTDIYNQISGHFSVTRKNPWPQVKNFIDSFPEKSLIGDIGCGNGRFMVMRNDCTFKGCDATQSFVDLCVERDLKVIYGDVTKIPFEDKHFDGVVCIAVLHHLVSEERRKLGISELIRILKPGGKLLIEVWSYEASFGTRFKFQTVDKENFNEQDKFLPWKKPNEAEEVVGHLRYYHLFKKEEIMGLVQKDVKIINCFLDHGNWFLVIEK